MEFDLEGVGIEKLETQFKRDEKILRFLTLKLDKHAVAYAEKMRALAKQKEPQTEKS
jgi:small subunit ribosomal protein S6